MTIAADVKAELGVRVLDHGYVEYVEHWGSDERIIESARMSTGKGFNGWGVEETCAKCKGRGTNEPENGPGSLCKVCRGRRTAINKPGDEKLLRFLYENAHMTPFEMAGATFEIQAPIFVFREWHRHRTQCLGPDTLVHFEAPKGDRAGRRFVYKMRIEDVWKKWQSTQRSTRPERQKNAFGPRGRIQAMRLRCADERRREFVQTRVFDVIRGEPKRMVRVTLASGKQLTATREHRVLTSQGWTILGEAIERRSLLACEGVTRGHAQRWEFPEPNEAREEWREIPGWPNYEVSSEGRVRRVGCSPKNSSPGANGYSVVSLSDGETAAYAVHTLVLRTFRGPCPDGMEARHINSNRADARLSNLEWATPKRNAQDRVEADRNQRLVVAFEEIVATEDVGDLPTYDLAVEGPWHNFVADGVVVHNSYNEMSARYTPLPNVCFLPDAHASVARSKAASEKNRQAGLVADAQILTLDVALELLEEEANLLMSVESLYQRKLKAGFPKELARTHLTVSRYSRMRASGNLRNWMQFLTLRKHSAAQVEIQAFATAVHRALSGLFPRTIKLFDEGHR
jgi:flavin-dependent thymidylate synthase